jgi:hypothetical protein
MGMHNHLNLPQLVAAISKLASWLRCLAPPWVSQEFAPELGLGPLDFSSPTSNGQEANCAAILLSAPELRGPRQVSELLFWLYGAQVTERLRQLAGGEAPGALDIAALGLTSLSTRWSRRSLSVWLSSGPRQNQRQEPPLFARHPLSIFIFRQGTPLLNVPGPIHKGPLADYVQSRQAANAMVVDDQPPQNALTELEALEKRGQHLFMAASCDGYSHLPDPVRIRRRVFVDESAKLINIVDQVQSGGEHQLRLYFHFPPHARLRKAPGNGYVITMKNEKWWFKSDVRASISLVSGQADPPLGWSAGEANAILPSPTLALSAAIIGSTRLNCSLALLPD